VASSLDKREKASAALRVLCRIAERSRGETEKGTQL
jgi:hypothetical protein